MLTEKFYNQKDWARVEGVAYKNGCERIPPTFLTGRKWEVDHQDKVQMRSSKLVMTDEVDESATMKGRRCVVYSSLYLYSIRTQPLSTAELQEHWWFLSARQ